MCKGPEVQINMETIRNATNSISLDHKIGLE